MKEFEDDMDRRIEQAIRTTKWQIPDLEERIIRDVQYISRSRKKIERDRKSAYIFFTLATVFGLVINFFPYHLVLAIENISINTLSTIFLFGIMLLFFLFIDSTFYSFLSRRHHYKVK